MTATAQPLPATPTAPVTQTAQTTQTAAPRASAPQKANYLQRCAEQVDPKNLSSLRTKSILWKVAAVASFVALGLFAFIAYTLTLGAMVAAAPLAGIAVPLIAIAGFSITVGSGFGAFMAHDKFSNFAKNRSMELQQCQEIANFHTPLKNATVEQLQNKLTQHEIPLNQNPETLKTLAPAIARIDMIQARLDKKTERRNEILTELNTINTSPQSSFLDQLVTDVIFQKRVEAVNLKQRILVDKIALAFARAGVIQPGFEGDTREAGRFTSSMLIARAMSAHSDLNFADTENFFFFNKTDARPISYNEASNLSVAQLSQRVIEAMA